METAISSAAANAVATSSVFGSQNFDVHAMTPESLMGYLRSRLGTLDKQMDEVFDREQRGERIRAEVHDVQAMLTSLAASGDKTSDKGQIPDLPAFDAELKAHLSEISALDPKLGQEMFAKIYGDGQVMNKDDGQFLKSELDGTKDYLSIVSKDLDASSQMDMISLQQFMSARQTAIQLATNLIASLADSAKSVVSNIR